MTATLTLLEEEVEKERATGWASLGISQSQVKLSSGKYLENMLGEAESGLELTEVGDDRHKMAAK